MRWSALASVSLALSMSAGCGLLLDLEGEARDAGGDVDAGSTRGDAGPTDGGGDASSSDAGSGDDDGGFTLPGPVTIGMAPSNVALPAVEWTGSEFAVALLVTADASAGTSVPYLHRYPPGALTTSEPPLALDPAEMARSSISIAVRGPSDVAVAWHDTGPTELNGVLLVGPLRSAMATLTDVDVSTDQHNLALFEDGGEWHAVVRRRDRATTDWRLWHVPMGPSAIASPMGAAFSAGDTIELDRVETGSSVTVVASGVGETYSFDGAEWSAGSAVSTTISTNECGIGARPAGGVWTLCSTAEEPRQLWLASLTLGAPLFEAPLAGWFGPDPVLAAHPEGASAAWVHEETLGTRSLGLGVLSLAGTPSPPCLVAPERPYVNDPDIACGGGFCAVVWVEGSARFANDFIVRFAQFPKSDPTHLCR